MAVVRDSGGRGGASVRGSSENAGGARGWRQNRIGRGRVSLAQGRDGARGVPDGGGVGWVIAVACADDELGGRKSTNVSEGTIMLTERWR
jgi:hypothetical protein